MTPSPNAHQERAPLLETMLDYRRRNSVRLHFPMHKAGGFFPQSLKPLFGAELLAMDLPSMPGYTDNPFHPKGALKEAQALTADLFGAGHSRFLVNGSSIGNLAAIMAVAGPGDAILTPRNLHRSAASALTLCGAKPVYLPTQRHPAHDALSPGLAAVRTAFDENPDIAALLLTRPNYYGLAGDVREIIAFCHGRGCPVIVDEAHGAHLRFLPRRPITPALDLGADLVVQSWHKTVGALTGAAVLHVGRASLIDIDAIQLALNTLQSTSPSNLLLVSIDETRRMLWRDGATAFAAAVEQAEALRARLRRLDGVSARLLDPALAAEGYTADPLRLVINCDGLKVSGFACAEFLNRACDIAWEMCDARNIVFIVGPQDTGADYDALVEALARLVVEAPALRPDPRFGSTQHEAPLPDLAMLPRNAAFARKRRVPLEQAAGGICAEMVMAYPPGNPLLTPGEAVSAEILQHARNLRDGGAQIMALDPSLETLLVVDGSTTGLSGRM